MKTAMMFSAAVLALGFVWLGWAKPSNTATEAPSGFDNQTIDPNFVAQSVHDADQTHFDTVEQAEKDGLGPIYNAQSCRECHQNPTSGAVSQVTELRVGHLGPGGLFENPSVPINHGQEGITGRTLCTDAALFPRRCGPQRDGYPQSPFSEGSDFDLQSQLSYRAERSAEPHRPPRRYRSLCPFHARFE